MKSATYEKLDKAIYKWFISVRHSNIPISASIIKLKALEFVKGLKCDKFQASDGWLRRWKERFNVRLKTVSCVRITNSSTVHLSKCLCNFLLRR